MTTQSGMVTPFGRQLTPGVSFLQSGGGKCEMVIKKMNENRQVSGFQVIKGYITAVLKEFNNRNKSLNPNDQKNIDAHLQKYGELESALLTDLCYIDEFNTLTDTLQDYKSDTLTIENLKKFVNRFEHINTKMQSTEAQLLDIISKIQDAMGRDEPMKKVTAHDWI